MRVWPTKFDGRSLVCVELDSPDGRALLEAPAAAVSAWLERTLRVVPPGSEQGLLGLDKGLSDLLAMASTDDLLPGGPRPSDEAPEAGA